MSTDTIETSVGSVPVLHRLALGLVVRDGVTDRNTSGALQVGWEAAGHLLPRDRRPEWPCVDFESVGTGRFRLRTMPRHPQSLTVRVDDPSRRFVPRRLSLTWWSPAELADPVPATAITVLSRTLHVWLSPGAAYPLTPGVTAIRGRVALQGAGVPWTRITAVGTTGATLGHAHGDDRGEFLLVLSTAAQNPLQSVVSVRLVVRGPTGSALLPPPETAVRPANPPNLPGDLDNAVLRGLDPPAGHVLSIPPSPLLTVPVGQELVLTTDIPFHP